MPPRTSRATRSKTVVTEPEMTVPVVPAPARSLRPVVFMLAILLGAALSVAGYFYYQYRHSATVASAKEIEDLTQEIGKALILPEGETPTLATVTDKEKLAEQAFFQKAENGDKVLIYSQSGRAILYRPSTKKIVDVTTVNVAQPTTSTPSQQTISEPAPQTTPATEQAPLITRVALLNGSTTIGVTNAVEKELAAAYTNVAVVSKDAAKKNDYQETLVIDVTRKNADMATKMAGTLSGKVSELPEGEGAPSDADIVVIVGQQ
jgi:hypothetical protein